MKAEKAHEKGTGDWDRYRDSQYADTMASTRKFVLAEMSSSDFCLSCEAIADTVNDVSDPIRLGLQILHLSRLLHKVACTWLRSIGHVTAQMQLIS